MLPFLDDKVSAKLNAAPVATLCEPPVLLQPKMLQGATLRPYQIRGVSWMAHMFRQGVSCILGDEMGLGKTLQSISILAYMRETMNIPGPHLIMVPKSTLSNWMSEFARWCPQMRLLRIHNNSDEERRRNIAALREVGSYDVCVTTYEMMQATVSNYRAWRFVGNFWYR